MTGNPSDQPTIQQAPRPGDDRRPGPPTVADLSPRFPQLEIMHLLGVGGMGAVYKARQKSLDRVVALKVLPPHPDRHESFAERFTREARALARLQHANIVTVYDSGSIDDLYYFIMEYVDGSNLRQALAAGLGRVEHAQAMIIGSAVCEALDYAHAEGIAHRDIKPENILIDRRGRVKIADFGIAKLLQRPETSYTLTHTQQIIGTMHYMAPEQIEKPASVDHRADIYSLGVVLYEMMTGELPIGRFPLPSERGIPDTRLDQVVLRALEKEPGRRYQRASEVRTDLLRIASVPNAGAATTSPLPALAPHPMSSTEGPAWRRASIPTPAPGRAFGSDASAAASAPGTGSSAGMQSLLTPFTPPMQGMRSDGIAYLCWAACLFGFAGLHRMYAGKWITGFLWFLTLGWLFIGQVIDLLLIPRMIRKANAAQYRALMPAAVPPPAPPIPPQQRWMRTVAMLVAMLILLVLLIAVTAAIVVPLLSAP